MAFGLVLVMAWAATRPERVTRKTFKTLHVGMSLGEIEQALGGTAPLVMPIFGKVNGKDHFAANFEPREKLRTQGYGDHVLREWWSPEISIMVVTDTQDRVECIYSGGGQSPPGLVPAILNALRRALRL